MSAAPEASSRQVPRATWGASPYSQPLSGEAGQEKPQLPPSRTAQRPPGPGEGLSAGGSADRRPGRPSPSAPTAPSRRRLTAAGEARPLPDPQTRQLGSTDFQSEPGALSTVAALRRLAHRLGHFPPFAAASPARSARRRLSASAASAASAGRTPLLELLPPRPSPRAAAGSGPDLKSFPLELTYSAKRFRRSSGSSRSSCIQFSLPKMTTYFARSLPTGSI